MAKTRERTTVATPITIIHWRDAVADNGWADGVTPDIHDCITAGFVVAENDDALVIASTISGIMTATCLSNVASNARMHIPKAWIIYREDVIIEDKQRQSQRKNTSTVDKRQNTSGVQS